jgi:hypothetical protein
MAAWRVAGAPRRARRIRLRRATGVAQRLRLRGGEVFGEGLAAIGHGERAVFDGHGKVRSGAMAGLWRCRVSA